MRGIKYLGQALRVGGLVLENVLKPFSPKKAAAVKKWRNIVADFLSMPFDATRSGIVKGLEKLGVPSSDAGDIADIIMWFL